MSRQSKTLLTTCISLAFIAMVVGFVVTRATAGPIVATQQQHQTPHRVQYTAKFVCGEVPDNIGDYPVVAGTYKTSLNVRNNTESDVQVDKHISVLVQGMDALGREPQWVNDLWQDQILLNPHTSTMDDCSRIYTITGIPIGTFIEGFFEFNAFTTGAREVPGLVVEAVYTASSLAAPDAAPSIDVHRIPNDYVM